MAAATSISLLVYLTDIAKGLGDNDKLAPLRSQLADAEGGAPQTILILGSDKRLGTRGDPGRSDTTILLRVDPDKDRIALLSIPRDLKVNIPTVGVGKFNEAYAAGGPELAFKMVKQLTGLDINHVVNINFTGFADAVNAIGCVYIDVDRHYYIPPNSGVAEINIEAGYQRLCGLKALQYVRFRHTDTDLVRIGSPAGLPARGASEAAAGDADPGAQRAARHLHEVHDLGHRRRGAPARAAEDVRRRAVGAGARGPLPGGRSVTARRAT